MTTPVRARLHNIVGGFVCLNRGFHNLQLVRYHWHERTGKTYEPTDATVGRFHLHEMQEKSAYRPFCITCWELPGD